MAQLFTVLDHHSRHQPAGALQNSLGDGYLMAHNSIYKRVRDFVASQKVEFTQSLTPEILALPLGQLEHFLNTKKIYYIDNVSVLKNVEAKNPNQISWDSLSSHLKRNMIFHESSHFLARFHFEKKLSLEKPSDLQNRKPSVLQIILEESFANTCELFAIKDVHDNIHKHFYEFNSYIFHFEQKSMIRDLISQLGFEKVFQWAMLSFAFSNFLYESLHERDFQKMADFVVLPSNTSPQMIKHLKYLNRLAFELNPDFKNATTAFYLKHLGYGDALQSLRNHKFMNDLTVGSPVKGAIIALSQSVL